MKLSDYTFRKIKDRIFLVLCILAFFIALIPLFWIIGEVIIRGISAFSLDILFTLPAPPGEKGGIGNAIQGSLILVLLATLIGFPLGFFIGIYIAEFKEKKFSKIVSFFVEVFAEFPAIVIGIFVYIIVVRALYLETLGINKICFLVFCIPSGFATIAGAISLALLMMPIIAKTTEEALKLVPVSIKEGALALGMSKWRVVLQISVSYARGGILTGLILGIARIIGEAAPLILTVLGSLYWFTSLNDRINALPLLIFYYGVSPYDDWRAQAWAASLLIVLIVLFISVFLKFLIRSKFRW